MRLDERLTNEEYDLKKQELLKEKLITKTQIDNYDNRVDDWLELTERAVNFLPMPEKSLFMALMTIKESLFRL